MLNVSTNFNTACKNTVREFYMNIYAIFSKVVVGVESFSTNFSWGGNYYDLVNGITDQLAQHLPFMSNMASLSNGTFSDGAKVITLFPTIGTTGRYITIATTSRSVLVDFTLKLYAEEIGLIHTYTITNNTQRIISLLIEEVDRSIIFSMELSITKITPNRAIELLQFCPAEIVKIETDKIIECQVDEKLDSGVDIFLNSVTSKTSTIILDNSVLNWNINQSYYSENVCFAVLIGIKTTDPSFQIEYTKFGNYFATEWYEDEENKTITIQAMDAFKFFGENQWLTTETFPILKYLLVKEQVNRSILTLLGDIESSLYYNISDEIINNTTTIQNVSYVPFDINQHEFLFYLTELDLSILMLRKNNMIKHLTTYEPNIIQPFYTISKDNYFSKKQIVYEKDTYNAIRITNDNVNFIKNDLKELSNYNDTNVKEYNIKNNPLHCATFGTLVTNIEIVNRDFYVPFSLKTIEFEWQGDPSLELYDYVQLVDGENIENEVIITGQKFVFDGGLRCITRGLTQ
jgi:hypothetical protein